jgi:hypothetical protein
MRRLLTLVTVLIACASWSLVQESLFGKSQAQALRMGLDGWIKHVRTQPKGAEEASLVSAYEFFNSARVSAYAKTYYRLPESRRDMLTSATVALWQIGEQLVDVQALAEVELPKHRIEKAKRLAYSSEAMWMLIRRTARAKLLLTGNVHTEMADAWEEKMISLAEKTGTREAVQERTEKVREAMLEYRSVVSNLPEREAIFMRLMLGHYLAPHVIKRPF